VTEKTSQHEKTSQSEKASQPENTPQQVKVRWENASTQSVYSNVCNVAGTREEIVLLFGMNQIIVSPFVAKRLAQLLNNVVADYENKYGALDK